MGLLGPSAQVTGKIRWRQKESTGSQESERVQMVNLLDQPARAMRALRGREIAMIFQEPMTALNPVMTIGRQVAESVQAHAPSCTRSEAKQKALKALEEVAIPDAAARYGDYPHQFSGGQRQRILIALALINRPRLLIADEPTTALDVTVQAQILALLAELQRQYGLAMLFISHDLAVVGQVASRVAVMRAGKVVETGPCTKLLTQPEHAYTKSLLRAVPTLRTDREQPLAMVEP
jgi:peptide/nickel transport system ATP-binding protein